VSAIGDEDVCWLDVAINDSLGVGGVEGVVDFDGEVEKLRDVGRLAGDLLL
jgi:hypothetical protein